MLADGVRSRGEVDVTICSTGDARFDGLAWLSQLNYWRGDPRQNLWTHSCYRLWYVQRLMEDLNLTDVLHFDNDVMLFENPELIISIAAGLYQKLAITSALDREVVFGMSYIPSHQSLAAVNDVVADELNRGWDYLFPAYSGYPHEMNIINRVAMEFVDSLPVLPDGDNRYANHYMEFGCVFDPSSYGQYLSGFIYENNSGFVASDHTIGKLILNGRMKVYMQNGRPVAEIDGMNHRIANLHVHSKHTELYL